MRLACVGLLVVALKICSGQVLTLPQQSSAFQGFRPQSLAFDDEESGDIRVVGLIQQYDLSGADDSTRQSLTVWPTSSAFLDGGLQSWVEQQLSAFESLKGLLIPRCPHASSVATPPQSDYPSLLSYMATSRFGPSILTAYARQVDQDLQPGAFSVSVYSESTDADEVPELDDTRLDAEVEDVLDDSWRPAHIGADTSDRLDEDWFAREEDFVVAADADEDTGRRLSQPLFSSNAFDQQFVDPAWAFEEGPAEPQDDFEWSEACNFVLFIILCIGCMAVWVGLMRAWVSCCRLEQKTKAARKAAALEFAPNPLLAPLIPEGAMHSSAFADVEVAAAHPPQGTYFAPQGSEYVSIAYVPLKSES